MLYLHIRDNIIQDHAVEEYVYDMKNSRLRLLLMNWNIESKQIYNVYTFNKVELHKSISIDC